MGRGLEFKEILGPLEIALESIPEHRTGENTTYTLIDAGLSAFSVPICNRRRFCRGSKTWSGKRGKTMPGIYF